MVSRPATLLLVTLCAPMSAEVRDLKAFFQEQCAVCHGHDGTGRGPTGGRLGGGSLGAGRREGRTSEADPTALILQGRGAMPGFRRQLSEAEARRLVATVAQLLAARRKP
jgi:mono/diheme cytochrome c family protein